MGICKIMAEHSERSRKAFRDRLKFLADTPPTLDVVIANYTESCGAPEFGLSWHRTGEDSSQYDHPHEKPQRPYMVGGLVYHSHSDKWGIHT